MAAELPHLEACVDVYLDVWERFEDESFDLEDLLVERPERERDALSSGALAPRQYLDLLTAYGLLEYAGDDAYRVRCTPDETELEWQNRFTDRGERLYGAVHSGEAEQAAGGDESLVAYRGQTYVSVFFERETDVEAVADYASDLHEAGELRSGLALRCPADGARTAQRVADALADPDAVASTALPFTFEKVNSEVKGADSDALQFRLYVAPADRD